MTIAYVQFSDETETKIVSVFGGPQDPNVYPNQGEVDDTDQRYIDYFHPPVDIVAVNTAAQAVLSTAASVAMVPYFLAQNLGNATDDDTIKGKAWQQYYRDLKLVDLTVADPTWPTMPE
ncbi:tail fiber assembly protein [Pseudomonas sp. 10C3]|uniref:tail fiber assembly protein n=1 Tax=Pseudomonas sp. 10C3 TaxID=3118753 RepID=UPI002E801BAC|nr:tail fiber assembly protein [Pseudomonas sp. 10C3]MEE3504822.1 tail fiber assembly protein [Pseudomonas sp. 10C3]